MKLMLNGNNVNMMMPLDHIRHIPHFHLIRMVECKLISLYLKGAFGPFLDLGCGDGEFGRSLGLKNVYGIDIDSDALFASQRHRYYAETRNAKASSIPYPDRFFGTVFSNCAIEHMDELDRVLGEVNRVLVDGGEFVFTVPTPIFFDFVNRDKLLNELHLANDEVIAEYNRIHHHLNLFTFEEWLTLLDRSGFMVLRHTPYLPGEFGSFVARMDMLYTIGTPILKQKVMELEKLHCSYKGIPFRYRVRKYISNVLAVDSGTHVIIKAKKFSIGE